MSKIDLTISNEMVIPTIESTWFINQRPETNFAVGMIAVGDQILAGRENEHEGYLKLRANVYAYQTAMIPVSDVRPDGTEVDTDDVRSTHWALLERSTENEGLAKVVGSIRTIEKRATDSRPLPIEEFFPEKFADDPLPIGSTEVSRYIARHENARVQAQMSAPLFKKVVAHITAHGLVPTFGVVEPSVERHLAGGLGVPIKRIAEPKFVPEYAADNLGISVDIAAMAKSMKLDTDKAINYIRATEQNIEHFSLRTDAKRTAA